MKGGLDVDTTTVRQVLSSLKNAEKEKRAPLTNEDVVRILMTEAKRRREAAEAFAKGDRKELQEREEKELAYISQYLPAQMSDEEIRAVVDRVIGTMSSPAVGAVMGAVMKELKGKADGGAVKRIVSSALSSA